MTGTYKLQKTELQKEGFDVTRIQDPVYFMGPKVGERTTTPFLRTKPTACWTVTATWPWWPTCRLPSSSLANSWSKIYLSTQVTKLRYVDIRQTTFHHFGYHGYFPAEACSMVDKPRLLV